MTHRKTVLSMAIGCAFVWLNAVCFAAASPEPLTVGYSSFSGAYLPLCRSGLPSKKAWGKNTALISKPYMRDAYDPSSCSPPGRCLLSWPPEPAL